MATLADRLRSIARLARDKGAFDGEVVAAKEAFKRTLSSLGVPASYLVYEMGYMRESDKAYKVAFRNRILWLPKAHSKKLDNNLFALAPWLADVEKLYE